MPLASAVGSASAAAGAVSAISLIKPTASPLQVWGLWFAAASLGVVTVAPLLIGLGDAMRERLPCHELMEGCPRLRSLDLARTLWALNGCPRSLRWPASSKRSLIS